MDPEDARAGHRGRGGHRFFDGAQRVGVVLHRRRDERREEPGDARRRQGLAGARVALDAGREEVDADDPVDVQVQEPRDRDPTAAARTGADPDLRHAPFGDHDIALDDLAVDQRGAHAQPQRAGGRRDGGGHVV
jgi:hypothetical protein